MDRMMDEGRWELVEPPIAVNGKWKNMLSNGLIDVNRDILMKLIRLVDDEKKIRNIIGITQTFYMWTKLPIFRWASENIEERENTMPDIPIFPLPCYSPQSQKCVIVGDKGSGKSSLLITHCKKKFPENLALTTFDNYESEVVIEGETISLQLWDTAGSEEYDRLRCLSYPGTDVFLICCSVDNRPSLKTVEEKWIRELKPYSEGIPIVLVGTKTDMRNRHKPYLCRYEMKEFVEKNKLARYVECSAKAQTGLDRVFTAVTCEALLRSVTPEKAKAKAKAKKRCFIQ